MKGVCTSFCLLAMSLCYGQPIESRLASAIKILEKDTQFKHAILSLYVVESKTGKLVYDKNSEIGLAPASTQKIVTSATAFELLGKEFR